MSNEPDNRNEKRKHRVDDMLRNMTQHAERKRIVKPDVPSNYGRIALYLQMISLIATAVYAVATAQSYMPGSDLKHIAPVIAMSGSTAIVMIYWSNLNGARALRNREDQLRPLAVFWVSLCEGLLLLILTVSNPNKNSLLNIAGFFLVTLLGLSIIACTGSKNTKRLN